MSKLILLSICIAMIAIPVRASREKDSKKGLRKMIKHMLIFEVCYTLAVRFLWGRFD